MLVVHPHSSGVDGGERRAQGKAGAPLRNLCHCWSSIADSIPRDKATGTSAAADGCAYEGRRLNAAARA